MLDPSDLPWVSGAAEGSGTRDVQRPKRILRRLGEAFPERIIEPVCLAGLPENTAELELARLLAAYGERRMKRIAGLPSQKASMAKLAFVGLQQRLLSSVAAFTRTLKFHRVTLQGVLDGEEAAGPSCYCGTSFRGCSCR